MFAVADAIWDYLADRNRVAWAAIPSKSIGLESATTLPALWVTPMDADPTQVLEIGEEQIFSFQVKLQVAENDKTGFIYHTNPDNRDSLYSAIIQLQMDGLECANIWIDGPLSVGTDTFHSGSTAQVDCLAANIAINAIAVRAAGPDTPGPAPTGPLQINQDFTFTAPALAHNRATTLSVANAWIYTGTGALTYEVAENRAPGRAFAEILDPTTPEVAITTGEDDGIASFNIRAIATTGEEVESSEIDLHSWTEGRHIDLPFDASGITQSGDYYYVKEANSRDLYRINEDGEIELALTHPRIPPEATLIAANIQGEETDLLFTARGAQFAAWRTQPADFDTLTQGRNVGSRITGISYSPEFEVVGVTTANAPNALQLFTLRNGDGMARTAFDRGDGTPSLTYTFQRSGVFTIDGFRKYSHARASDNVAGVETDTIYEDALDGIGIDHRQVEVADYGDILDIAAHQTQTEIGVLDGPRRVILVRPNDLRPEPHSAYGTGRAENVVTRGATHGEVEAHRMFQGQGLQPGRELHYTCFLAGGAADFSTDISPAEIVTTSNSTPALFDITANPSDPLGSYDGGLVATCALRDTATQTIIGTRKQTPLRYVSIR